MSVRTSRSLFLDGGDTFDGGTTLVQRQPSTAQTTSITVPPAGAAPTTATPATTASAPAAAVVIAAPTPRRAPTALPVPVVVGSARYTAADYAGAARALLPRGRAWPENPDSVLGQLLLGIGKALERSDAMLDLVLSGSLPGSLTPMLPEWEAVLGLPDPCAGDAPTIDQRRDQVRGRFVGSGGQSRRRFIDFAAALGFTIAITNYAPFRVGQSPVGQPIAGDDWSFVWGVTVLATTGALPVDVLMCELEAVKPAESTVILLS